ncbi:MAG TPA: hypothetical protein VL096_21320 [Pirellulaceae bacterium]|nr:hypothetical protein [Pirellulaceae bacterium]
MRRIFAGLLLVATTAASAGAQQFSSPELPSASSPQPEKNVAPSAASDTTPINSVPPAPPSPAPLATRQTTFSIPFSIAAKTGTVEVQLHVSHDRGATWAIHSRQRPEAGQFFFRAAEDGEYWFASRLVDAQGRGALAPGERPQPELRVRVDTAPPQADLAARIGPSGEVIATFSASDGDLVVESVQLEYQPAGEQHWQPVVLDASKIKSTLGKISGEASWFPKTSQRAIGLRVIARDGASNSTVLNRGVYLPSGPKKSTTDAPRSPAPIDADPFRRDEVSTSSKPAQPWPSDATSTPVASATTPESRDPFRPVQSVSAPVAPPVADRVPSTPATSEIARPSSTPPSIPFTNPSSVAPMSAPPAPTESEHVGLPPGEQPHFTKQKRFKLDYDSSDVPAEQVADVELWGTHDAGKTWLKWGTDPDRQSPFEVEVEREGVFGFRIVVVHKNGLAGLTPRAGDAADIWISVDGTVPTAKFGSVAFGKGINAGQVDIQWSASDTWLTSRPVTLSYATAPEGPWSVIAAGLANTGQFFWRVEPSVPRKVYLKLDVRDDAGNLTEDRLPEPLELEGLIPRGKIKGLAD